MEVEFIASDLSEEANFEFDDSNVQEGSNFESERCGICMDIIIDRGVLDCCQHWFCFTCIDNWATITNLCPLCQNEFQLITCVPVYDTIGTNKVDDESFSRDDDWCIEGKNNTLSFPSYYIDENSVICLDGDECKIRKASSSIDGNSNLDTSIACDSCDIWYHAFCVGFDPESTTENAWLCPRCVANNPQKSDDSPQRISNNCGSENANGECLVEAALSAKVSVSVADAGETAVVVSLVGGNQLSEDPSKNFLPTIEVDKELKTETCLVSSDSNNLKAETSPTDGTGIKSSLEAQDLELSLSHERSSRSASDAVLLNKLKTSCAHGKLSESSSLDEVKISSRKSYGEPPIGNESSGENSCGMGLHLGLSVSSFLSVGDINNDRDEVQVTGSAKQQICTENSLSKVEETVLNANEDSIRLIGLKRKHKDCSNRADDHGQREAKNETEVNVKKIKAEEKVQMIQSKKQVNTYVSGDQNARAVSVDKRLKRKNAEKLDDHVDIMSLVGESDARPRKRILSSNSTESCSKEKENIAGLRVKKIMRRAAEDKDSSMLVQNLRKEIREAVHNKSSKDIGENLFDPKLLAAFRAAVGGPKDEPTKKLSPLAVKAKKSMLHRGKIRENLTKKIYGTSNGRRKRAWDRDCEIEFWKHRCIRATKPEKVETLKSVLDLLRESSGRTETEESTQPAANPILSRLYLADTSVFPRKDDIKPLVAIDPVSQSEPNMEQCISGDDGPKRSNDNHPGKFLQKTEVVLPSSHVRENKSSVISKNGASSSKVHASRSSERSAPSPAGGCEVAQKDKDDKSNNRKSDKRKWALEVLSRKTAAVSRNTTADDREDNPTLKKNYPLLAQLPRDMRPVLAPSSHNKIPISVRQTQLYRLTEYFLRKANLHVIRRTAETELAVADAINIEKTVAERSNSRLVYVNLCSQELSHRTDVSRSSRTSESNPKPASPVPHDGSEQSTDNCSIDSEAEEALKAAGLLSCSPPNSPHYKTEVHGDDNDCSLGIRENDPDNILEMDCHPELDIYGDFEYDLGDEDYIGASTVKVTKLHEESGSKVKVVFSSLNSQTLKNSQEDSEKSGQPDISEDSDLLKSCVDEKTANSTVDNGAEKSLHLETYTSIGNAEASATECEELYGPDKELLANKFPNTALNKFDGLLDTSDFGSGNKEEKGAADSSHEYGSSNQSHKVERIGSKAKQSTSAAADKQAKSDTGNSVYKKVEAYIKEHIRPLCKSGVITAEQYRWAVAKTTDKVMKYHGKANNANFLIKEGDKVKKLAEQYVEAAQQRRQSTN